MFWRRERPRFELHTHKMIVKVLFDGSFTRSKEKKLEVVTRVNERFPIVSQVFICGQDPENLSKVEWAVIATGLGLPLWEGASLGR